MNFDVICNEMWVYGVLILCVLLYINELLTTCCVGYIVITILVLYIINVVHTVCESILIISYGFS